MKTSLKTSSAKVMTLFIAAVLCVATFPLQTPTAGTGVASWGLDRIDQRSLPLDNSYRQRLTGKGVSLYAVDTGVNGSHSEFAGRVVDGYTRVADGRGTNDCHGHGTHTAATAAGTTVGVAPGLTVIPVRVYGCAGSGWTTDLAAGIRWAIEHHQAGVPAVMNISTSGPLSNTLNWAVQDAIADGIVVVAAAGNNGRDACSYSPGAVPEAITVGATEANDTRLDNSNFGRCVDLFAPGAWITSAWSSGPNDLRSLKGTSFAAPHVTGIAALILEANPTATPAQVAQIIISSATPGVISGLDGGSPNLLAFAPFGTSTTDASATTTIPVPTTSLAPTTTTSSTTPPSMPVTTTSTTTMPPSSQTATVTARRAARGNFLVQVTGAAPHSTFAIRAVNSSRRTARSASWLVTVDGNGYTMFFVRMDLSGFQLTIVR